MEHEQKALLQNTRISGRLQKCKKTVLKYFIRQLCGWLSAVWKEAEQRLRTRAGVRAMGWENSSGHHFQSGKVE
jgi:hypothetical protein